MDDYPLFRRTDPHSSRAAAVKVRPKVGSQCATLLDLITSHPDRTAGELSQLGPLDFHTICRRVSVLERNGAIAVTGERKCRVRDNVARTYRRMQ